MAIPFRAKVGWPGAAANVSPHGSVAETFAWPDWPCGVIRIVERELFQLTVGEPQIFASMFQNIDFPKGLQCFRETM